MNSRDLVTSLRGLLHEASHRIQELEARKTQLEKHNKQLDSEIEQIHMNTTMNSSSTSAKEELQGRGEGGTYNANSNANANADANANANAETRGGEGSGGRMKTKVKAEPKPARKGIYSQEELTKFLESNTCNSLMRFLSKLNQCALGKPSMRRNPGVIDAVRNAHAHTAVAAAVAKEEEEDDDFNGNDDGDDYNNDDGNEGGKETVVHKYENGALIDEILRCLETTEHRLQNHPPVGQQQRFGNTAFRTWYDEMAANAKQDMHRILDKCPCIPTPGGILGEQMSKTDVATELSEYWIRCFGDRSRIDYGTGHEAAFLMWLFVLYTTGAISTTSDGKVNPEVDERGLERLVLQVFPAYIRLVDTVQATYMLEPAGSHGVWSLDDYHFLPFVFGSAQMMPLENVQRNSELRTGEEQQSGVAAPSSNFAARPGRGTKPSYPPSMIRDLDTVDDLAPSNMFFQALQTILRIKSGPFAEHSPLLNDLSGLASWDDINDGLIRMFKGEVLGKFPVAQHFVFGTLLPRTWPSVADDPNFDTSEANIRPRNPMAAAAAVATTANTTIGAAAGGGGTAGVPHTVMQGVEGGFDAISKYFRRPTIATTFSSAPAIHGGSSSSRSVLSSYAPQQPISSSSSSGGSSSPTLPSSSSSSSTSPSNLRSNLKSPGSLMTAGLASASLDTDTNKSSNADANGSPPSPSLSQGASISEMTNAPAKYMLLPDNGGISFFGDDAWTLEARSGRISSDAECEQWKKHRKELDFPLPEMLFGSSFMRFTHLPTETEIEFQPFDALAGCKVQTDATTGELDRNCFKVAHAHLWEARKDPSSGAKIETWREDFDWTFTTLYAGTKTRKKKASSVGSSATTSNEASSRVPVESEPTEKRINYELLKLREPILWFSEVILFEDDLYDSGISKLSVKVRAMPSCFFALLRNFVRVDDTYVRVFDTRVYHRFGENFVLFEKSRKEASYETLRKAKVLPQVTNAALVEPDQVSSLLDKVEGADVLGGSQTEELRLR